MEIVDPAGVMKIQGILQSALKKPEMSWSFILQNEGIVLTFLQNQFHLDKRGITLILSRVTCFFSYYGPLTVKD